MAEKKKKLVIFRAKSGAIELRGGFERDTVWATQVDIVKIFSVDRTVVTRHIQNILKQGEVDRKSDVQKMHIAKSDKPVAIYSLGKNGVRYLSLHVPHRRREIRYHSPS